VSTCNDAALYTSRHTLRHCLRSPDPEMTNDPLPSASVLDSHTSALRINEVFMELRRRLNIPPNERQPDWQSSVSSMIGALVVDFSRQENPDIAFVDITLVSFAAQKGSKDAKKRALRPIRWISSRPPSISELFHEVDEARAAVRVLQPLSAEWVESYICDELTKNKWTELTPSLTDWLLNSSSSIESFLRALNRTVQTSKDECEIWITSVIECATKSLAKSHVSAGIGMMSEVADLASFLNLTKSGASSGSFETSQKGAKAALLALIAQVSSTEPSVLIQGASVSAIGALCSAGEQNSVLARDLEVLCRRTVSLLTVLIPEADQIRRTHYRGIWSVYRDGFTSADQILKKSIREFPILRLLESLPDDETVADDVGVSAGVENVICSLVVNWDDYFALHSDDPAAQQLFGRIEELCQQLGISRFGEIGGQVVFDPVRHFIPDYLPAPPSKVVVVKPGITLKRPDGSSRVLLMAVVKPLDDS
jgi:hypothetical protein